MTSSSPLYIRVKPHKVNTPTFVMFGGYINLVYFTVHTFVCEIFQLVLIIQITKEELFGNINYVVTFWFLSIAALIKYQITKHDA